jgi:hypothetical protein
MLLQQITCHLKRTSGLSLIAAILCMVLPAGSLLSQAAKPASPSAAAAKPAQPSPTAQPTTYLPNPMPRRAHAYYSLYWGVDLFSVKAIESGELIRFSYHILDASRARLLNDKSMQPYLIAPAAHARLVVPSLEKVGQLRQSSTPENGKVYWMAFSNSGRLVKRGDRVNIVIGQFHADGLVVE